MGERFALFWGLGAGCILCGVIMLGFRVYLRLTRRTAGEVARNMVKVAKRTVETPRDRRRVDRKAFEPLHAEFFDRVQRELESQGFRYLGDWQDRTLLKLNRLYIVVRTMISSD